MKANGNTVLWKQKFCNTLFLNKQLESGLNPQSCFNIFRVLGAQSCLVVWPSNLCEEYSNFQIQNQYLWSVILKFYQCTYFFYEQPVYKQLALGWQITKQLSGLKLLSLSDNKNYRL